MVGDGVASVPSQARRIRVSFGFVALVGVVGMVIAMAMATTAWWWDQSASALGTDLTGGRYFNITMVALGIAFLPVAIVMNRLLRDAAAAGIALVGLFRIDEGSRANAIHNIAGFAIPLIVMAMMLTAGFGTNEMFPRFSRRSIVILAAIALVLVLYVGAIAGLVGYAVMELAAFGLAGVWLTWFLLRLGSLAGGAAPTRPSNPPTTTS